MLFAINLYIIHFGTGLAILLALSEIARHGRAAFRSALFYLAVLLASIQLRVGLLLARAEPAGGSALQSEWYLLFFASAIAFGPVSVLLIRRMAAFAVQPQGGLSRWHIGLAVAAALAEILARISGTALPVDWLFLAAAVYLSCLAVYCQALLYSVARRFDIDHLALYTLGLSLPGFGQLFFFVGYFAETRWLMHLGADLITLFLVSLFLVPARFPGFLESMQREIERQRYARTSLAGLDLDETAARLEELMSAGLYREENLYLNELADRLGLNANQLSRILNERYQQNFSEFVNSYRIAAARQLLIQQPERTVLSIAYEAGFQSKSTFNAQFLRQVGTTPAQFRRASASQSGPDS